MTAAAFIGGGLDRAAHLRGGEAWRDSVQVIPLWRGMVSIDAGDRLVRLDPGHPALADGADCVFLGLDRGKPVAARDISAWLPAALPETELFIDPSEQVHPAIPGARFVGLRDVMTRLSPMDAELAATGRALTGWHASHRFCAACGHASQTRQSGWQRQCPACGASHFPRTDPVVIMLVERGDRVLLGRSPGWPPGMFSCLAGFVEPGETIETAVAREVAEETGVRVGTVRYVACQPWPFPGSLMIGMTAEAQTETIAVDPTEIEEARWVGRDELVAVMAGDHPQIRTPRQGAMARVLLDLWLASPLSPLSAIPAQVTAGAG